MREILLNYDEDFRGIKQLTATPQHAISPQTNKIRDLESMNQMIMEYQANNSRVCGPLMNIIDNHN